MSPAISLDEAADGAVLGDRRKPLYVLDWPQSRRILCRPALNGRLATPERWLFSEQLHRAAVSEAMSPTTPQKILAQVFIL